jgi:hypothetical protein
VWLDEATLPVHLRRTTTGATDREATTRTMGSERSSRSGCGEQMHLVLRAFANQEVVRGVIYDGKSGWKADGISAGENALIGGNNRRAGRDASSVSGE